MELNDYLRKINYTPNTANIPESIMKGFEEEKRKEELEKKKTEKIMQMQRDVESQKASQDAMAQNLKELVILQHEYNDIIQNQCEELKRQNIQQEKELKKQKIWNCITYGITTLIAIASVVGTFIGGPVVGFALGTAVAFGQNAINEWVKNN